MDYKSFDPDNITSLAQITKWREYEKGVERKSRNNIKGLLVEIYGKPTHFVYELIQNADDAGAKRIKLLMTSEGLVFYHDGPKDFSLKDVFGITAIGYLDSEKRNNNESIGKYGVGFKSVFAVTKTPYIYNRTFCFRIEDFTIPYKEKSIPLGDYTTIIKIPFSKTDTYSKADIMKRLVDEFNKIDTATIMFLRNIERVDIEYRSKRTTIGIERCKKKNYELINNPAENEEYISFKDPTTHTSIVFRKNENEIAPLDSPKIYSFLPTDEQSELSFYVDAPFNLKINRGMIDFEEKKNQEILENIKELFAKSLGTLKNEGYINADFLEKVMPMDEELLGRSTVYDALYQTIKKIIQKDDFLPTTSGKYVNAKGGLLYSDNEMANLLNKGVLWFDIKENHYNTRQFLVNELEIKEVDIVEFARIVSKNLNNNTSKEFLYRFYELCAMSVGQYDYWNINSLKRIPIIMTRNGKFRSVCDNNGDEQLFRPSKGLQPAQIINNMFLDIKDEYRRNNINHLLNVLGIGTRTPAQTIQKTIMAKWDKYSNDEKLAKFFEINELYNDLSEKDKEDVIKLLRDKPILRYTLNNKRTWASASEMLIGSKEQLLLYDGLNIPILDKKLLKSNKIIDEKVIKGTEDFCRDLGIITGFPFIEDDYHYDYCHETLLDEETIKKYNIPTHDYNNWWSQKRKRILKLKEVIKRIRTEEQAKAMVALLSRIDNRDQFSETVAGCNYRGYRPHDPKNIPSEFIREINKGKWVIIKGRKISSLKLSKKEFVKEFKLNGHELFLSWLEFLPEAIDQLPQKQREYLELYLSLSEEKQKEYLEKMQKDKESGSETLDPTEIEAEINIEDDFPTLALQDPTEDSTNLSYLDTYDIIGAASDGNNQKTVTAKTKRKTVTSNNRQNEQKNQRYKKALGDYGEMKIKKILIKNYGAKKVKEYGGNNKGYDFKIEEDGEDKYYIEVKTLGNRGHVDITPSEWNYAKTHREKYLIYVLDANTAKYRIIKDPYGLYLKNKINIDVTGFWYKEAI